MRGQQPGEGSAEYHARLSAEIDAARAAKRAAGKPMGRGYRPPNDNARPDRDHS